MMKLNFDYQFNPEPWTIVLCHRTLEKIGILHNVDSLKGSFNLNEPQEISFDLHKILNDEEEALWDEVYNLRVIWIKELNAYFQIEVNIADTQVDNIKSITATSLCEAELSQIMLYDIEINTEEDVRNFITLHPDEDYEEAVFWNKEYPEKSLLWKVLEKAPHYTIKHIDDSLANLQRNEIKIDGVSIYDWLVGECSEMFDCIFEFDSTDRSISVYDLFSVCDNPNCNYYTEHHRKYRGEFSDFCPKCGSRNILRYGRDTNIVVDTKNLTEEVNFETDVDSIKNTFRLVAGDDYMTQTIRNCNPNGSDYIHYFSEEMYHDMSPALSQRIRDYDTLYDNYKDEYAQVMEDYYDKLDEIAWLEDAMSPTRTTADMNAQTEIANLTNSNLSPIVVPYIDQATLTEVSNAVESYCKCFFRSGYFKVKILDDDYNSSSHVWTGKIKLINRSDPANAEERDNGDVATTSTLTIQVYGADQNSTMYEQFVKQKMEKIIAQDTAKEKDNVIFQILKPYITLGNFKNYIKQWSASRLKSFADAIESCKTSMMNIGIGKDRGMTYSQEQAYQNIWLPYHDKYVAIMGGIYSDDTIETNGECRKREIEIKAKNAELIQLQERQEQIQNTLNFKNYLGSLYDEFNSFLRMDTYQNDNYISDLYLLDDGSGQYDNAGLFENARKYLEEANKQIQISAEYQHSISTNLYNLLVMEEFKNLTDYFELGNYIRVRCDGNIYRLRLIHYEVDFNDLSTLNTEFSDMTKTGDSLNDVRSILDSARSMATSYGYTQKAAISGGYAYGTLEEFRKEGLKSALYKISNNDQEEVTFDNNGLWAKSYDDITGSYLDKQLRITHNIMAFTSDNWKTVKMALGDFNYTDENGILRNGYGVNSDFVVSGFIQGSTIVGGKIYSPIRQDGTHMTVIDLENGNVNIGNGNFTYDNGSGKVTIVGGVYSGATITGGSFETTSGGFKVNNNGTFNIGNGNIVYDGSKVTFGNGIIISWNNISNTPEILSRNDVTTITQNSISTASISANNITAGTLRSDIIYGGTISASNITSGTLQSDITYTGYISANQINTGTISSERIDTDQLVAKQLLTTDGSGSIGKIGISAGNMSFLAVGSITNRVAKITSETSGTLCLAGKKGICFTEDIDTTTWLGSNMFKCDIPVKFTQVSHGTTSSYLMRIDSDGNLSYTQSSNYNEPSGSSKRFKYDIKDLNTKDFDPYKMLNIPIRQFKYNSKSEMAKKYQDKDTIGLIAEEVEEQYPIAAIYDDNDVIIDWSEKVIVPSMLKIIQDQQKEIERLKSEIKDINNRLK